MIVDWLNNLAGSQRNLNLHVCLGLLKGGELAIEQICAHKMALALIEPLLNNFIVSLEVNQYDSFID